MRLPFLKERELYLSLYRIIGLYPHSIYYYKLALIHKSLAGGTQCTESLKKSRKKSRKGFRTPVKTLNNERLEFLGDAVLDAIAGDIVFHHFPGKNEGFLTNTRSKIVQRDTLNRLAAEMGINDLILAAGDSRKSHNSYLGGNAFEALVGALYLDRGYDACMHFMKKRILREMINIDKVAYKIVNFKSRLIEWCQKNHIQLEFRILEEKCVENMSPSFVSEIVLEGIETCPSKGFTKKESQQLAAKETLDRLKHEPQFIDEVFAAKTKRTKMEEEPVGNVPDTKPQDFIIPNATVEEEKHVTTFTEKVYGKNDAAPEDSAVSEQNGATDVAEHKESDAAVLTNKGEELQIDSDKPADDDSDNAETAPAKAEKTDSDDNSDDEQSAGNEEKATEDANETAEDDNAEDDEFDLSGISVKPDSAEDIITAAEEEAYKNQ